MRPPLLLGHMGPGGGAFQVAGLLGANTEVGEGDQLPASCRQCARRAGEGLVGVSSFQELLIRGWDEGRNRASR